MPRRPGSTGGCGPRPVRRRDRLRDRQGRRRRGRVRRARPHPARAPRRRRQVGSDRGLGRRQRVARADGRARARRGGGRQARVDRLVGVFFREATRRRASARHRVRRLSLLDHGGDAATAAARGPRARVACRSTTSPPTNGITTTNCSPAPRSKRVGGCGPGCRPRVHRLDVRTRRDRRRPGVYRQQLRTVVAGLAFRVGTGRRGRVRPRPDGRRRRAGGHRRRRRRVRRRDDATSFVARGHAAEVGDALAAVCRALPAFTDDDFTQLADTILDESPQPATLLSTLLSVSLRRARLRDVDPSAPRAAARRRRHRRARGRRASSIGPMPRSGRPDRLPRASHSRCRRVSDLHCRPAPRPSAPHRRGARTRGSARCSAMRSTARCSPRCRTRRSSRCAHSRTRSSSDSPTRTSPERCPKSGSRRWSDDLAYVTLSLRHRRIGKRRHRSGPRQPRRLLRARTRSRGAGGGRSRRSGSGAPNATTPNGSPRCSPATSCARDGSGCWTGSSIGRRRHAPTEVQEVFTELREDDRAHDPVRCRHRRPGDDAARTNRRSDRRRQAVPPGAGHRHAGGRRSSRRRRRRRHVFERRPTADVCYDDCVAVVDYPDQSLALYDIDGTTIEFAAVDWRDGDRRMRPLSPRSTGRDARRPADARRRRSRRATLDDEGGDTPTQNDA